MKDYLIDLKFYRIINGYFEIQIKDQKYKIVYPNNKIKYEAEKLYVSLMQDSRFDTEYLNYSQLEKILTHNNLWSDEQHEQLENIENEINNLKIKLFQNYSSEEIKKRLRFEIKHIKGYESELLNIKHSLDYLTLDFFASNIKNQYLISQCILNMQDEPVFDTDYYKIDLSLLKNIISEIDKNKISAEDLRLICKGDTWRRYLCQDNIFGAASIELNDDQINLLNLQKMYDNVRQHPECPEEEIIQDPDALDGWFLFQKAKNKETKKKNKALSKVRGKVNNHDFVYVITNDKEEAQAIEELNDFRGKNIVNAVRELKLKDGEKIKWRDIPYIKQEIKSDIYKNQKQGVPK